MSDKALRDHLVAMLTETNAHVSFEDAVALFSPDLRGTRGASFPHTGWQLLEHLRICQWDILEFSRNPKHRSPDFPDGYWLESASPPTDDAWDKSVADFRHDLAEMVALVRDESVDVYAKIPHGDGQTVLREALVLAKHNSYHVGQLVMLGKALGSLDG